MRALEQMQVLSPLRICGITKAQVRSLSREAGLFTWNKPAYACLATRIPAGREINDNTLKQIERTELKLSGLGFKNFRARLKDRGLRLELTEKQMPLALEKRAELLAVLAADFEEITLDLRPRREVEA